MVEGQDLPELVRGPITRGTLALFAGASHDHVPFHIDSDVAKGFGMDDVFAHGMLSMAYLGQAVKGWARPERLLTWNARFTAITPLGAAVTCRGTVTEVIEANGEKRARIRIGAWTDKGVQTLDGEAIVAIEGTDHG